jgi:hypothetical protein
MRLPIAVGGQYAAISDIYDGQRHQKIKWTAFCMGLATVANEMDAPV